MLKTGMSYSYPIRFYSRVDYSWLVVGSDEILGDELIMMADSENGGEAVPMRKLPSSSKYKGVIPQPNGRWGAQLYDKHRRIWLGTFKEQEEAAKAYNVAARRFRGDAALKRNFALSGTNIQDNYHDDDHDHIETMFLNSRSGAEIVDMLRKHTYFDELEQSRRNLVLQSKPGPPQKLSVCEREQLFGKVVTPSDVGKLNRMVIPKQYAEKHLPLQLITSSSNGSLLNFEDNHGKIWRFRYSFWHSSQTYVLTKGWRRFVKEKNLKAGDVVRFHRSTGSDNRLFIELEQQDRSGKQADSGQIVRLFGVNLFGNS